MKLEIELSEEQLALMINALEVTFRIMMGQGSIVSNLLAECPVKSECKDKESWDNAFHMYLARRECAEYQINALSDTLYGAYGPLPEDAYRYSDMWSALRHLQYQLHPTDHWDVRSSKSFQMSDYPMMKVELIEEVEK